MTSINNNETVNNTTENTQTVDYAGTGTNVLGTVASFLDEFSGVIRGVAIAGTCVASAAWAITTITSGAAAASEGSLDAAGAFFDSPAIWVAVVFTAVALIFSYVSGKSFKTPLVTALVCGIAAPLIVAIVGNVAIVVAAICFIVFLVIQISIYGRKPANNLFIRFDRDSNTMHVGDPVGGWKDR
jgi:hypothetical protein